LRFLHNENRNRNVSTGCFGINIFLIITVGGLELERIEDEQQRERSLESLRA
jgi:hypothetical protein